MTIFRRRRRTKKNGVWTSAELQRLRALADAGSTAGEIAQQLGRSPDAVARKAAKRIHIRVPTQLGNKEWLQLKLRNLKRRAQGLLASVSAARSKKAAGELSPKLLHCQTTVERLNAFARSNGVATSSYQRLLLAIRDSLAKIKMILNRRRADFWKELLAIAATVLAVFNSFLILLKNIGLITLPLVLAT